MSARHRSSEPGSEAGGPLYYGGQAVIEGVMMRGRRHAAIAVRRPDGSIALHREELRGLYTGRTRRIPFLRGISVLAETLVLGSRALIFSSNVAMGKEPEQVGKGALATMLLFSLSFVILVFFAGPVLISQRLESLTNVTVALVLEGVIRLVMVLGYIALIGLMPDVRRVFAYHGAEHMTIHAYEHRRPLRPEDIRRFPTEHPRCGTAFLLTVVVISIVVFTALGTPPLWWRVLSRLLLLPIIAAVSYEALRFSARYAGWLPVRLLFAPNLWLQSLTTRRPDESMIEVAVAAFRDVIEAEGMRIDDRGAVVAS